MVLKTKQINGITTSRNFSETSCPEKSRSKENILTKESAAFVDIIHTNGGFEPCVVCSTDCKQLNAVQILTL